MKNVPKKEKEKYKLAKLIKSQERKTNAKSQESKCRSCLHHLHIARRTVIQFEREF